MSQFEQRANIKFMCRLVKSASETLSALQQVYGDTALKKSAVYDWFSRFKNGLEKLEDDQRSGRPSTSRTSGMIENVRQLIQCDRISNDARSQNIKKKYMKFESVLGRNVTESKNTRTKHF
jgi:transposase